MISVTCSLIGSCLLLNCLMFHNSHGITACDPGWFGPHCQFKCLCTGSHCDSAGQCVAGSKCKPGYFGPACQYGDIVQLKSLTSDVPVWLGDGDDATCSSDPSLQSVTLRFHEGLSFSWFRISVSSSDALNRFEVKLNNEIGCLNMKNATVDDTSMDVYCSVDTPVTSLTLSGPGLQSLCSVYISLGRNVAAGVPTGDSSINLHGELGTTLLTSGMYQGTRAPGSSHVCPQTVKAESSWNHTFRTPQSVTALFWTRNDDRSSEFSLKTFGAAGQLLNSLVAGKDDYYIPIQGPQPVSMLSISSNFNELLNLCELFIFGETLCPDGTFGLDCESLCECADRRYTCLISTGKCAAACSDGFYGQNCSVPCPNFCRNGICTPRHGDCIDAPRRALVRRRKTPSKKRKGCPLGFYGKFCNNTCSPNCHYRCESNFGACLKCPDGFYGDNCSLKCVADCHIGRCVGDLGYCVDCESARWGNHCEKDCGENCYLQECYTANGSCTSCAAGYTGDTCVKVPWNVTLFIVLLFLIPSVIACFFCCEVLSDEDAEGQSDNFDMDKDMMSTEVSDQASTSAL